MDHYTHVSHLSRALKSCHHFTTLLRTPATKSR